MLTTLPSANGRFPWPDMLLDMPKLRHPLPVVAGQIELSRLPCEKTLGTRWAQNDHSRGNAVFRSTNSVLRGRRISSDHHYYDDQQSKPLVAVGRSSKP